MCKIGLGVLPKVAVQHTGQTSSVRAISNRSGAIDKIALYTPCFCQLCIAHLECGSERTVNALTGSPQYSAVLTYGRDKSVANRNYLSSTQCDGYCIACETDGLTGTMISAMELAAEMGNLRALGRAFEKLDPWIKQTRDPRILRRLRNLIAFYNRARAVEEKWGEGATLNLCHPEVVSWIIQGLIEPHRIRMAKDFAKSGPHKEA
ncbi:hypothetical protein [Microvirga terricola]|uniref:Uncharacterized protein n=1 Tax=Microvirga terricola TaxID=2719797 RepID=A0ABX0VBY6_9HYPH|nr:hypothetical protein [Microvirga terricola]NIX77365.1 hypothetical protein [Microvirga terricola]